MLQQYRFSLPTTVRFGVGVIKEAGECAKSLGATHAMIVADQGSSGRVSPGMWRPACKARGSPISTTTRRSQPQRLSLCGGL